VDEAAAAPSARGFTTVQALRAFACLLVVAYHALYQWGRSIVPGQPSIELWPNGSAGVDLFFVISGFVMLVSSGRLRARADGWRVFAMRRLERIVPLYWGLTLVKLAVVVARPGLAPATRPTPWHVVATLLFIPARDAAGVVRPILPVGWTLNFEMLFYALFAACLAARAPPLLLLPAALLPLAVAGMFARPDWPAPFWLADPLVLEFVFGVAIGAALGRVRRLSPWLAAILVGAGGAALLAMPCGPHERFAIWGGAAALMLIGAVALEDLLAGRLPRRVLAVGDASYAIYLVHLFVLPPIGAAVHRAGLGGDGALALILATGLAGSVVAGLALHAWVDAPMQAWFREKKDVLF
jgi:peptidoglycan/LPS O-acetylase OafA/YrhL